MTAVPPVRKSNRRLIITLIAVALLLVMLVVTAVAIVGAKVLGQARDHARLVKAQSNLHMLMIGIATYNVQNKDILPPHLGALIPDLAVNPRSAPVFVDPRSTTTPPSIPPHFSGRVLTPAEWKTLVTELDAHCDFVYTGDWDASVSKPPLARYTNPSAIALWSKIPQKDGYLVARWDSSVQVLSGKDLRDAIKDTQECRERDLHLPPAPHLLPPVK